MNIRLNPKYSMQWVFMQGKTDEVCPQRLFRKEVKPQAIGGRNV